MYIQSKRDRGETGTLYQHDPRHVDVIVKSLVFENEEHNANTNSSRCERRESSAVRPRSNLQVLISCGQMHVPQPRQGRHDIRRERAVPENVRSFTTQLRQI